MRRGAQLRRQSAAGEGRAGVPGAADWVPPIGCRETAHAALEPPSSSEMAADVLAEVPLPGLCLRNPTTTGSHMTVVQQITREVQSLPEAIQREVLDFVEFLKTRRLPVEDDGWSGFSLAHAMRGLEDEPDLYSSADIRNPAP